MHLKHLFEECEEDWYLFLTRVATIFNNKLSSFNQPPLEKKEMNEELIKGTIEETLRAMRLRMSRLHALDDGNIEELSEIMTARLLKAEAAKKLADTAGPKTVQELVKGVNDTKIRLAEERDELREMLNELEALLEDKDEDIQKLDEVVDSLSRYV